MDRGPWRVLPVVLAVCALAACGDGGESSADATGSTAPRPTATTTAPTTDTALPEPEPEPLVVQVDGRDVNLAGIGSAAPTLGDAVAAFGEPSSREPVRDLACHVRWSDIGLFAIYANLGGRDACDPEAGRLQTATLSSPRWRTARGLAVGAGLSELRRLHPEARRTMGTWALVTAPTAVGTGGEVTVLGARVEDGTVTALEVYVGAAGD